MPRACASRRDGGSIADDDVIVDMISRLTDKIPDSKLSNTKEIELVDWAIEMNG